LLDCASIAAITALRHFRKPDVTVNGEDITIVSGSEKGEDLRKVTKLTSGLVRSV
jgi:exosome complex RNA-binding protein Rrp42 (RNase PH superfamily)